MRTSTGLKHARSKTDAFWRQVREVFWDAPFQTVYLFRRKTAAMMSHVKQPKSLCGMANNMEDVGF
jgi:hypothetical protein